MMTKTELVDSLAREEGITTKQSNRVVTGLFDLVAEKLSEGENVKIQNFGTFSTRESRKRSFKNPKTKERQMLSPKKHPIFIPSTRLKKKVQGGVG